MSSLSERNPEDLWSRLRESMERLEAIGQQKNEPAQLAKRLEGRAKQLRGRVATERTTETPVVFLAFHQGHHRYGILAEDVVEVQALDQFSPVPRTPPFISGVMHWRGNVLSLLDLGKLLELPESGLADIHVCLIVEAANCRVAVVALEIEEILTVPPGDVKPIPELPANIPPEWILGIHDKNRILLRMDNILQDAKLMDWRK